MTASKIAGFVLAAALGLSCLTPTAVVADTDPAFLWLFAARNAIKAGDAATAVARYRALVERFPTHWQARTEYGWVLMSLGKPKEALRQFETVARSNPGHVDSQTAYARALLSVGRINEAAHVLNAMSDTKHPDILLLQADIFLRKMRLGAAARIFESLRGGPLDKPATMGLADVATTVGDHARSGLLLQELLAQDPTDQNVLTRWIINLVHRGHLLTAGRLLPSLRDEALRGRTEGEFLLITRQVHQAVSRLNTLLLRSPTDPVLLRSLALAHRGAGDERSAETIYRRLLDDMPDDADTMLDLAEVLMASGERSEAESLISRAMEQAPVSVRARYVKLWSRRRDLTPGEIRMRYGELLADLHETEDVTLLRTLMVRAHDDRGLALVAEQQLAQQGAAPDTPLLYVAALQRLGLQDHGIKTLRSEFGQAPADPSIRTALAALLVDQHREEEAQHLVESVPASFPATAVLYRSGAASRAREMAEHAAEADAHSMTAVAWLANTELAIGEEVQARHMLDITLAGQSPDIQAAMLLYLANFQDGSDAYRSTIADYLSAALPGTPANEDLIVAKARLLGALGRYAEAVDTFRAVETNVDRPPVMLAVARLLGQQRYLAESLERYERYLAARPQDLDVRRESLRLLGASGRFTDARSGYEDLQVSNPGNMSLTLERTAKTAVWRGHYRRAAETDVERLEREPANLDALNDLALIDVVRGIPVDGEGAYRRMLALAPDFRYAERGAAVARLAEAPVVVAGYGAIRQSGFGGKLQTSYRPATAETVIPVGTHLLVGAGYQFVSFNFDTSHPSSHVARASVLYFPSRYWHADASVTALDYAELGKATLNAAGGVSYEARNGVRMRLEAARQDLWQNVRSTGNVHFDRVSGGVDVLPTERIELGAGGGYWHYSDNNRSGTGQLMAAYKLVTFPTVVRAVYYLDALAFRRDSPAYFSPNLFVKNTAALEFQHFLGFPAHGEYYPTPPLNRHSLTRFDQFVGWPMRPEYLPSFNRNSYAVQLAASVDNNSNVYYQETATFSHAVTDALHLNATVLFIQSQIFDEKFVSGYVDWRF